MTKRRQLIWGFVFLIGIVLRGNSSDSTLFDAVLRQHVVDGRVDYQALRDDTRLDQYLAQMAATDPAMLSNREERLALWINAYNAYTLKLVADNFPVASIHDIGTGGRIMGWLIKRTPWDIRFAVVGGRELTLNEIEHEVIRKEFAEPRIHFAVVCAAISCPPLRGEAYVADRLDDQLNEQARLFIGDGVNNVFDLVEKRARLSRIFSWYKEDFGHTDEAVLAFVTSYVSGAARGGLAGQPEQWSLHYSDYDWALNGKP